MEEELVERFFNSEDDFERYLFEITYVYTYVEVIYRPRSGRGFYKFKLSKE